MHASCSYFVDETKIVSIGIVEHLIGLHSYFNITPSCYVQNRIALAHIINCQWVASEVHESLKRSLKLHRTPFDFSSTEIIFYEYMDEGKNVAVAA